jgi:hypothetical protein
MLFFTAHIHVAGTAPSLVLGWSSFKSGTGYWFSWMRLESLKKTTGSYLNVRYDRFPVPQSSSHLHLTLTSAVKTAAITKEWKQRNQIVVFTQACVQGEIQLCWPVHDSVLHGLLRGAYEFCRLIADNIWNKGKFFLFFFLIIIILRIYVSLQVKPPSSSEKNVSRSSISASTTDCRNELKKWTLLAGSRGCKAWIIVIL